MLYREAGDFKTSYTADNQTFPIAFDRWSYGLLLAVAVFVVPFVINDYWLNAVLLPFLIYAIAALGLNILTGYCGQVSLGTGGFMAVGAYACYKLMTAFPDISIFFHVIGGGLVTAGVGILFGLPSLRIKGFYLAVATLAAQFFLVWLFNRVPWFYNYSATGQINAPERMVFGVPVTGENTQPWAEYLFCLFFVVVLAWMARNLTRGTLGRTWMAIRDMDIAAEIIGVNPLKAKLSAFAISSFFVGVSGALFFAVYLGAVEVGEVYGIQKSFLVLFMIIIGGLGSIQGAFFGAAFLVLLPVLLKNVLAGAPFPTEELNLAVLSLGTIMLWGAWLSIGASILLGIWTGISKRTMHGIPGLLAGLGIALLLLQSTLLGGLGWPTDLAAHLEFVIIGVLIIGFLIAEPHGLAQLWRLAKEKLRLWPFPH